MNNKMILPCLRYSNNDTHNNNITANNESATKLKIQHQLVPSIQSNYRTKSKRNSPFGKLNSNRPNPIVIFARRRRSRLTRRSVTFLAALQVTPFEQFPNYRLFTESPAHVEHFFDVFGCEWGRRYAGSI